MDDRWRNTTPGPYATLLRERGTVTITALEENRYLVCAQGALLLQREVTGHDPAHQLAHELADRLS